MGIRSVPVVGVASSPAGLRDASAVGRIESRGAALRLYSKEWVPNGPTEASRVLKSVGLASSAIDLVIDFGAVMSLVEVNRSLTESSTILDWVGSQRWRSVTVASGAFPPSISHLPKGEPPSALDRFDALLFEGVTNAWTGQELWFGDFAVNHPSVSTPPQQGPLPNLRYTYGRHWEVSREEKAGAGNESFFNLCGRVVSSPFWPTAGPNYSWGDREIDSKSRRVGGPGGATQWRAYGTSHHMAEVIERLAMEGVP
jgi:hypothetical protein